MDTGRGTSHTRSLFRDGRARGGIAGSWGGGGIILGETLNVGDGGMDAANHHGMCILR